MTEKRRSGAAEIIPLRKRAPGEEQGGQKGGRAGGKGGGKEAGRCPICGKPSSPEQQPFCSPRCAEIDLGRWLKGVYRIPSEEAPSEEEPAEPERGDEEPE